MKPKNLDTRANKKIFIIASVILIGIIMIVAMIYKSSSTKEIIQGQESKSLSQEDENSFDYGTEKGKVIIMYQDEDGNKIAENDEIEGIVGKEYTTSRKEISHYVAAKKDPLNKIGNYKKEDITVVYQYKLIQNLVKTNVSEGNNVTIQIGNERQSRDYKLVLMQETEEGKKLTGGKFKIQSDITVDGTTTNGKLTIGAINVQSEGTENYTITEEEAPQGFEKTLISNYVLQIQKKYNNENKQYELIATSQNNELELEQTQNDEILLTIKNKKIQTNEIALKKILTSINDTQTKKEVTARIENGKVVYDKSEEPLEVKKGEILGLLGPNGSGKTTTINCILSLLNYQNGSIKILGKEMKPDEYELKKQIGVVFQEVAVFEELNVYDNIDYFCGLYIENKKIRKKYIEDAIKLVGLENYKKYYPKQLSGGLLRRLNIACGIAHKPKIIFLDEPTVAVDPQSRNNILEGIEKLRKKGATIVYTTHYMEEVEILCDRIIILDKGKILATGTSDELKELADIDEKITVELNEINNEFIEDIKKFKYVDDIEINSNILIIKYKKGKNNLEKLIDCLKSHKITYNKIFSERPTLNDVFLNLTGKELRD